MPIVTQNLSALAGAFGVSDVNPGFAVFRLMNYTGDLPRTTGAIFTILKVTAVADGSYNISKALTANESITPAGTAYEVTLLSSVGGFVAIGKCRVHIDGTLEVI